MVNEIAAVGIGKFLTDVSASAEDKAKCREALATLGKDVNVVYQQNTADVVNIAIPDFEGFEAGVAQALKDADLEQISGGEIGITIGLFVGWIGVTVAAGLGISGVVAAGAGSVVAAVLGTAVLIATVGGGLAAIGAVGAGIGVGVAAAVGAFDGGNDVNIGHAS
ncbi:MAG: hypothetical protein OXU34_06350 [Gammaproteobacteria bacterium]|nr:hypothetical protein [Gammaproteobacteria bacterium]